MKEKIIYLIIATILSGIVGCKREKTYSQAELNSASNFWVGEVMSFSNRLDMVVSNSAHWEFEHSRKQAELDNINTNIIPGWIAKYELATNETARISNSWNSLLIASNALAAKYERLLASHSKLTSSLTRPTVTRPIVTVAAETNKTTCLYTLPVIQASMSGMSFDQDGFLGGKAALFVNDTPKKIKVLIRGLTWEKCRAAFILKPGDRARLNLPPGQYLYRWDTEGPRPFNGKWNDDEWEDGYLAIGPHKFEVTKNLSAQYPGIGWCYGGVRFHKKDLESSP